MNRRKALAISVASAATLVSFGIALAATLNVGVLGFNEHRSARLVPAATIVTTTTGAPDPTTVAPQVVVEQKDVFDRHVVTIPDPAPSDAGAPASAAPAIASEESDDAPRSTTTSTTTAPSSSLAHDHEDDGEADDHSTSTSSTSSTEMPPPGCRDGVLEDDGVWNCQH